MQRKILTSTVISMALATIGAPAWAGPTSRPPATTKATVKGAIGDKYYSLGGSNSFLGQPQGDEFCGLRDGGCGQKFDGGMIYWSPATNAHFVRGRILAKYAEHRWEQGFMGYPVTDEFCGLRDGGCGQHFQFERASIYWQFTSDAHSIQGAIRDEWASKGWENSGYGYPVTDEYQDGNSRASDFTNGWITWTPGVGINGAWRP